MKFWLPAACPHLTAATCSTASPPGAALRAAGAHATHCRPAHRSARQGPRLSFHLRLLRPSSTLRRNCTPPLLTRHADCALHLGSLASLHRAARHSTHQGPLPTPSFRLLHHKSSSHHTAGNVSTERSRQPTQCASSTTAHTSSVDDALLSSHDSGLSLPDAQPPVAAAPPPPGSPMLGRHTKGRPQLAQMRSLPREMRVFV